MAKKQSSGKVRPAQKPRTRNQTTTRNTRASSAKSSGVDPASSPPRERGVDLADVVVKGAREHNLQSVSVTLPRNQLICLTGVSGSGKSSLAFDTVYAEGQRRYIESLSSFARHFLGQMPKPEVDLISGLSPSISISQKSTGANPRSTVGTITEIYDYLRVLYARVGRGYCPECRGPITAQSREQIVQQILALPEGSRFQVLAPLIRGQKGEYRDLFEDLLKQGFARVRVDGHGATLSDPPRLDRQMRHDIEVVVDRLVVEPGIRSRLYEAVELALKYGEGNLIVAVETDEQATAVESSAEQEGELSLARGRSAAGRDQVYSAHYACTACQLSFEPPSPQLFSFNSPRGMCRTCDGLGVVHTFDPELLIPDPSKSFKRGCFDHLDVWKELGRWRRHIYQGVADTMERVLDLESGRLLETPWQQLTRKEQDIWLWGTGNQHITFTWRSGSSPMKYGGIFEGLIPELEAKFREAKSAPARRRLETYMTTRPCSQCEGTRLNRQAGAVRIRSTHAEFGDQGELSLPEVCNLSIQQAIHFFDALDLSATEAEIAVEAIKEIRSRLGFLLNVGLNYLTLSRTAPTLSGGETQRIRLASQIGSGLVGVLYILDEPSIGLHARDNQQLIDTLHRLRDMGNTVLVVEHDEDTMRAADYLVDFGPGPGVRGGTIVSHGSPDKVAKSRKSVTGKYLSGRLAIEVPSERRAADGPQLGVRGARHNNLQNVDVDIPLGTLTCVTGVSGSGKSSLVNGILVEALRRDLNFGEGEPGEHQAIEGIEHLDKLIAIDQSPIGRTPRSNPGTYIKVFDEIRKLFTQLPDAKKRGFKPGRFSFNVKGGRCEACEGNGSNRLEMDFLADVWVECPVCEGQRYNRETLQVKFKGKSISEVLEMDVQEALEFFENVPAIQHRLQTLHDVGLDYLKLGQPSPTLSGGEAQRIKLARELVKKSTGQTLYLLDEPTTGLHFADIQLLLDVLHRFVAAGNTVLIVEHNLDVIKTADWVIDLGPEGGVGGGTIVVAGTPEDVARCPDSHTGRALAPLLGIAHADAAKDTSEPPPPARPAQRMDAIRVKGAAQHNLKSVDTVIGREKMTVFCGPSGSGKSSLAMDTIYAEGQRRYVESLSSYARQFVSQVQKPKVESIEGLSPAIAIEQKNLGHSPRSTVGTVTEIYDYLRILMARLGEPYCPDCQCPVGTQTSDQLVDRLLSETEGTRMYLMAPLEVDPGQSYEDLWREIRGLGYLRVRIDDETVHLDEAPSLDRRGKHEINVVVDRVVIRAQDRSRIAESVEAALTLGKGVMNIAIVQEKVSEDRWEQRCFSQHLSCGQCGRGFDRLAPNNFSFNSPLGWCESCEGLGTQIGANPNALLRGQHLTLREGALELWPDLSQPLAARMLESLAESTGIPLDVPFYQLPQRLRRLLFHGTGNQWFDVQDEQDQLLFRFQFKGFYPALDEAARASTRFRYKLEAYVDEVECSTCNGSRVRADAGAMRFQDQTIGDLTEMPLGQLLKQVKAWKLDKRGKTIAGEVLREVKSRLEFLNDVGLEYLTLGRGAATLSNGEAQRIRLASQLGSGLCGVLYVLDEPTIGLHPRDNHRLLKALHRLRDLGNTLLVVEHDREVIDGSDEICDFGPAAGRHGGQITAQGTPASLAGHPGSLTGQYLAGTRSLPIPKNRRVQLMSQVKVKPPESDLQHEWEATHPGLTYLSPSGEWLDVLGARHNNLKNIDIHIPLGALTVVTGPSGGGKSSLVDEILYPVLARRLHRATVVAGAHQDLRGMQFINKVIRVDQQPLGNSPTSNPATYTGLFELVRDLFAQLPESKLRGYTGRRFSFNVPGGRCEKCEGNGQIRIEMHFLPDVWVQCEACEGRRYDSETLSVNYRGKNINDVLEMTCGEAVKLFENIPKLRRILQTLCDVGLDYVTLGQSAPTLSGGEAQRVKLAAELARPDTGRTLYLLDEPTTGLHFDDLAKLLEVMQRLVDTGNTVVLIEHNLDVIKSADWMIDIGPEAGDQGGQVVVEGPPEEVVAHARAAKRKSSRNQLRSHTGEALAPVLKQGPYVARKAFDPDQQFKQREGDLEIHEVGRDIKMPWEIDGLKWHCHDRVDRKGQACRWDGRILQEVVERIQEHEGFAPTNWSSRGVVEIAGENKSAGWFLHALTGETWLLKLKFRVPRQTFTAAQLHQRFPLPTLNDLDDVPMYSNDYRVTCKNATGPWQEVQFKLYQWDEINLPEFWTFVDEAARAFLPKVDSISNNPQDYMPWKKLGRAWHLMDKGFPIGKTVRWNVGMLESLLNRLEEVSAGQYTWQQQKVVHLNVPFLPTPWATLHTKRSDSLLIVLTGPKDLVTMGRIHDLGWRSDLDLSHSEYDRVRIELRTRQQAEAQAFTDFLKEHFQRVQAAVEASSR